VTEPQPIDFKQIIAAIEAKIGRHSLSKMMRRQYVQITRMAEKGRVQHYEGQMLLMIYDYVVPREKELQNVSSSSPILR
jgi:hypothetical protein